MKRKAVEDDRLDGRVKELEERVALFEHEAVSGAHLISQFEATLRVAERARHKLEAIIARQSEEIKDRRREIAEMKQRLAEMRERVEQETSERIRAAQEAVRTEMGVKMRKIIECAEAVRREGVEAFEEARALKKPASSAPVPPGLE